MRQRKLNGNNIKRIVFRSTAEFHQALSDFAHSQRKSMAMVIEEAVNGHIKNAQKMTGCNIYMTENGQQNQNSIEDNR